MPKIKLRRIPGFPNYAVSRDGIVVSFKGEKPKKMNPKPGRVTGGLRYTLYIKDGSMLVKSIGWILLVTFVGPQPKNHRAYRKDRTKGHTLDNMKWLRIEGK